MIYCQPCLCGATDCPACYPLSHMLDGAADALNDLCLGVGDLFEEADKAGFRCELTANPDRDGNVDWRLAISGTAADVACSADVDAACIEKLGDLLEFLKARQQRCGKAGAA